MNLDQRLLEEFWEMHGPFWPEKTIEDFRIEWKPGYAYFYEIFEKESNFSALKVHVSVADNFLDKDKIANEMSKALKQIEAGDYDEGPPISDQPKINIREFIENIK